ncbi:hypothetical protein LP419_15250 [Massilia sp. H-1]|nr:hypothetical protein LP419_15250 [Massilia sp. H-1]
MLGKILETRSEGMLDEYGLAPVQFNEKRFRKPPTTVTFDRAVKAMNFSDGEQAYALAGGEQDRSSVQFQLASVARGAGKIRGRFGMEVLRGKWRLTPSSGCSR